MSEQMTEYKVTVTWAGESERVVATIPAWGPGNAAETAVRDAWCGEHGERGEEEAIVEVATEGGTVWRFYEASVEPEVHVSTRKISPMQAAEDLTRWAERDAKFKAKTAEREAAKSPREKLFDLVRKTKKRALTRQDVLRFFELTDVLANDPADTTDLNDWKVINALCSTLMDFVSVGERVDELIAQLPLDGQSTSSPVSASTT